MGKCLREQKRSCQYRHQGFSAKSIPHPLSPLSSNDTSFIFPTFFKKNLFPSRKLVSRATVRRRRRRRHYAAAVLPPFSPFPKRTWTNGQEGELKSSKSEMGPNGLETLFIAASLGLLLVGHAAYSGSTKMGAAASYSGGSQKIFFEGGRTLLMQMGFCPLTFPLVTV